MSAFQWIIDNAAAIEIDTQPVVASTTTRDGTVRSVSRGGQPWVFTITMPQGPRWSDYRGFIANADRYDRHTTQTIQFNNTGHDWLLAYQGDMTGPFYATWTTGASTFTMSGGTGSSGYRVRAGDLVQLGASGSVYKVLEDVAYNASTVRVHRPIIDTSDAGVAMNVGADCVFTIKATQFPTPRIFARNQVSWNGPFVFVENLV